MLPSKKLINTKSINNILSRAMKCNKGFSSSYMLLNADEVGLFDLFHILFHGDIDQRKFVDAPGKNHETFHRRWLIFLSILVQKALLFLAKPMASLGSALEMWLNLLYSNQNFLVLLLNFFRGKVVIPDKTSSTFISFIGNQDRRLALDSRIKHGDSRYYPALSMMASKLSYENPAFVRAVVEDLWKMEFLGSFDFWNGYRKKATTQASMFYEKTADEDTIVVAFRGTSPFDAEDWASDFDISWYKIYGVGKLHGGFMKALGLQKSTGWPKEYSFEGDQTHPPAPPAYYFIRDQLRQLLKQNKRAKFVVTGHSLGGALAILFPAILILHDEKELLERMEGVYTFGQPRVGDAKFGKFMETKLKEHSVKYLRFVYCNDMVPRLPMDDSALMFKHFGTCIYHDSLYAGKIVHEEPNKNYFSPVRVVPMMLNSCWELIRSFAMKYTRGAEYNEVSFMKAFRVIGLVVPGVSAHSTYDYVNATRLASPDLFLLDRDRNV